MERNKSFQMKTLRLHPHEEQILDRASDALFGIDRARLMSEAVLFEAMRLGIRFSTTPPPPYKERWPYTPERGDEPTGVRLCITLSLPVLEILAKAADYVSVSEPLFIIGSTLAYVGRLQKCFDGSAIGDEGDAAAIRTKLQKIKMPPQYEYRRRGMR